MNERGVIYMTWKDAVGLALEGREEGYNFLYQQTYQKSYYVALKYMKQEEEAADVLQDAYISRHFRIWISFRNRINFRDGFQKS